MTSSGFLGEPQTLLKSLIKFDFLLIKHDQVNRETLSNLCGSSLKIFTVQSYFVGCLKQAHGQK